MSNAHPLSSGRRCFGTGYGPSVTGFRPSDYGFDCGDGCVGVVGTTGIGPFDGPTRTTPTPVRTPVVDPGRPPSKGCTAQRIYSGLMGAANLGIAVGKGFALGGAVAGAGATVAGAPAAAVLGVYGTVSIFGQGLAGTAQLYSASTGNYGTPATIAQVGNILAGPVSGLGTLTAGGSMESAEERAGYESFATAASSVIDAINAGAEGLGLALGDHSTGYFGAFANGGNPCGAGH